MLSPAGSKASWSAKVKRSSTALRARARHSGLGRQRLILQHLSHSAVALPTSHPAKGISSRDRPNSRTGALVHLPPRIRLEDFIEGFRPQQNVSGQLVFQLHDEIFKKLCADAAREPGRNFLLLVDEINRGDIPRIFGELLTLLELDKRGMTIRLPLSGERFAVPPNLYMLGTMNTADRSIALLDTALRRRFGFVELMPDASILDKASAGDIPLGPWLVALNDRLRMHLGRDARNLQIGHSYLLENSKPISDFSRFVRVLAEDLVPLLEEYCYDNYSALTQILGSGLVDEAAQRIREELFSPDREQELISTAWRCARYRNHFCRNRRLRGVIGRDR